MNALMEDPNDPAQRELWHRDDAPHETAGVLRMHRGGMSGPRITNVFDLPNAQLMHEMQRALDQEQEAHAKGVPIHDAGLPKDPAERANYLKAYGK